MYFIFDARYDLSYKAFAYLTLQYTFIKIARENTWEHHSITVTRYMFKKSRYFKNKEQS